MSLDNRNTSAQYKRAEQLKRWEESEMNKKLSGAPKSPSSRRIKFSSGCIFLAACVAGDKEEVEWLLKNGADIDTANVDGLTALHQACIDDNLDMVEFLVQKGADVNRKDNEGWTPLHATASCGFLSIARYLIENGADLASINSDGELAVDLANSDAMEDLIQHHLDEQGIDCEEARQAEERIMLSDATKWLRTDSPDCDKAHPKTGATAIHVAAAKGYIGVLKLLLEGRGDIDRQDVDGWTPLHAAAYWGQKEATQMLLNASADIDVQNYSGQLAIDIAQDDIVPLLKDARKNGKRTKRRPPSHGNRITDNFENSTETPTKVIRVEVKPIDSNKEKEVSEKENKPTEPDVILRRTQSFESDEKFYQRYAELRARIQANSCPHTILPSTPINTKTSTASNNNNNSSNNNNNNNNSTTTTTTATTPASNISSYLVQRSASLKDHRTLRKTTSNLVLGSTTTSPSSATGPASGATTNLVPPAATGTGAANNTTGSTTGSSGAVSPPTSPSGTPTTTPTAGQIRRSFVPPTRDEESETQRKAHAKRVRETRRSTQGVTLDEIKSAEQLVKKKNATGTGNENDTMAPATATATTTTTTTPSSPSSLSSTASPSFTNDRVPAVGSTGDQQQQGSNHVTEGSGAHDATGGSGGGGSTKVEEIAVSASFTLAAPGSSLDDGGDGGGGGGGGGGHRRHRRSVAGMDDEEEDDSKVTVSYTISAPVRQSSPSPRAVASAAAVSNSKESADPLDGTGAGDVPAVTATFHVPAAASEPMVATSATIRTSSGATGGVVSNSDSNTTTTTTTNNTSNSNNNNTSASSNTNHNTAATTTYTKRSLFDIDNANSLTLAEKLRHEANKYAIAAVADGDLDSHLVARVPASNSGTTNSGGGGGESNSTSTNAPADNSAASAGAAVPPSPTLRKADPATTTTTGVTAERRPSWRLKVDGGSKFKLEDASTPNAATQSSSVASGGSVYEPSGPANQAPEHGLTTTKLTSSSALAQRRAQQQNGDSSSTATTGTTSSSVASSRPLSAPASGLAAGEQYNRVPGSAASAAGEQQQTGAAATDPNSPLHHLRRPPKSAGEENKENDKENDSRSTAQATQAVIQRRRRQKRRSTGVVSVGMEDLDPDRQDSPVDGDEKETGSERGRSRVGSTASELDTANQPQDSTRENGGDCIDYKALYEQEKADNDKLKMALRKKDEEVVTLKAALDRFTTATTKNNSLSELEKRERRAMERKMSEMEEELKLLQKYKTENERLRAENRALTRVVSKLTTSAQNQIHASKQ